MSLLFPSTHFGSKFRILEPRRAQLTSCRLCVKFKAIFPRATTTIPSKVQKKRGIINPCAGYMVMCTSSRLRRRHSSTTAFQKRSRLSRCRHRELAWNMFSNTVKAGRHFRPRPCGAPKLLRKELILSREYPEKRTTAASALQRQWFVDTGYSSDWYQNLACEFLHSDILPELGIQSNPYARR